VAKSVLAGKFRAEAVYQGLGGMVAIAPFGAAVPADVQKLVNDAAIQIKKGFNPFTGPLKDNQGNLALPPGASIGNDQMGNFNWYVEGVVGKVR